MPIDIMIDIETLGTKPGCIVSQVGWAMFQTDELSLISRGSVAFHVGEQLSRGLTLDQDTVDWWLTQDRIVRTHALCGSTDLKTGLAAISKVYENLDENSCTWADPLGFDIPILGALFDHVGMDRPWDWRKVRDGKTLRTMMGYSREDSGVLNDSRHNAESDAVAQAEHVMNCMRMLRE